MRKDLEWEYADAEVLETKIKEIGLQLGFQLPQDYIDCVKINGGASVLPEEFKVGNVERCFGSLFSFDEESSEYIVKKYEIYKPTLPQKVFPIAIDPAGNLMCLDYKNNTENPIVVFGSMRMLAKRNVNASRRFNRSTSRRTGKRKCIFVANTFTEFLSKLHD